MALTGTHEVSINGKLIQVSVIFPLMLLIRETTARARDIRHINVWEENVLHETKKSKHDVTLAASKHNLLTV